MATNPVSNSDDLIDIRDVIEEFEELDDNENRDEDEQERWQELFDLLGDCIGQGGDEQWRGDWYPVTLIRDTYFRTYAEELADDIGAVAKDAGWPSSFIDWEAAADALKQDYSIVTYGGVDYWTR